MVAHDDANRALTGAPAEGQGQTPYRVLVVDDNVDAARSMALLLQLEGYSVRCAYDGQQALHCVHEDAPQAVLLDIGLPRLDGLQVARCLRDEPGPAARQRLLIAVSGYGRDHDRAAARAAGFDHHLTKPADPERVLALLAEHRRAAESRPLSA